VAVVFALSWPALIRSLEAKRWSAALISLVALALAGAYSVTVALGSAAGDRANAAKTETATTDTRKKAQDAYDTAKAEVAALKPTRPLAELEAIIARNPEAGGRCAFVNGSMRTVCPPHPLAPELARAKRRAELEGKIERATSELAKTGPAKVANSDAKALARYLAAIGLNVTPDRLNDLLALLAVLMIEAGGGLSLALGMALGAVPAGRTEPPADAAVSDPERPQTPPMEALVDATTIASVQPSKASGHQRPPAVHTGDLTAWLRAKGEAAQTSMRRLALELGRSPAGVHVEVGRLAAAGVLTALAGSRETVLTLVAGARPN
jgi:hypothetical protein